MKYSESEIDKKIELLSSSRSKNINRAKMYLRFFCVTAAVVAVLTICFGISGIIRGLIDSAPVAEALNLMPQGLTTKIYDSEGRRIQNITSFDANREYVKIADVPDNVKYAFVVAQDPRFYEHEGIDLQTFAKAVYSGIINDNMNKDDSYTITQRLLKNQVFGGGNEKSVFARFSKKIQEQCIVVEFENKVNKEQILEYYLNTIILGKNTIGIEAASKWYFDKNVSELNLSEAAVLAGIDGNPSGYDPINNQEKNAINRRSVLKSMLDEGYIKEEEYEDALGDDVYTRIRKTNEGKYIEEKVNNSFYVDVLIDNVVDDLMDKLGYTETQAYNAIYRGGLKIYTCMDSGVQRICNEVINDDKYYPGDSTKYLTYHLTVENSLGDQKEYSERDIKAYIVDHKNARSSLYYTDENEALKDIEVFKKDTLLPSDKIKVENIEFIKQPQASFVIIEQTSGRVRAITGGRGDKNADWNINRASVSKRQPGSVFDILSTYLPALDTCGVTLADVEDDAPYKIPGTNEYVRKPDNNEYNGLTNIRDAIVNANSIVALKTLEKVSPQIGYDYLMNLGFSTLVDIREDENGDTYSDIKLPIAIGELTDGVTNLELTAAYAGISNGGKYIKPSFYTKIIDNDGNILIDNEPENTRIMKESTAWLLTNVMQDVTASGTGKEAAFTDIDMAQAGKNGSTKEYTDCWFEGFTPYYTAGIWMGNDRNKKENLSSYSMKIWKTIMENVHEYKSFKKKDFKMPSDIKSCGICTKCGLMVIKGLCDKAEDGNDIRTEYFVKGTEPKEYCKCHIRYKSSADKKSESRILLQKDESGYKSKTKDTPYIVPK